MRRKTGICCANTDHFDGKDITQCAILFNVYESSLDPIFAENLSLAY